MLTTIAGYASIDGAASLTDMSLPALTSTAGLFVYDVPALTTLRADALTTIGAYGLIIEGSSSLTTVSLASLESIGAGLWCVGSPNLAIFALPRLSSVAGDFRLDSNALAAIDLPMLASVGPFMVSGCAAATSFSAPALVNVVGPFSVQSNPQLPLCQVIAVQEALLEHDASSDSLEGNLDPCAASPRDSSWCVASCGAPGDSVCAP